MATSATNPTQKWDRMKEEANKANPEDLDLLIYALTREEARRDSLALIPDHEATFPQTDKETAAMPPISGDWNASKARMIREMKLITDMIAKKRTLGPKPIRGADVADTATNAQLVIDFMIKEKNWIDLQNQIKEAQQAQDYWLAAWNFALQQEEDILSNKHKGKAKPSNSRLDDWVKCDEEGCTWWVAGNGMGKPRMAAHEPDAHKQYDVKRNPDQGILQDNGNNPRDDGRGDTGRLERYRQAYKDHQDRHHKKGGLKDMIPISAAVFRPNMNDLEFKEEKEQWIRYNQRNPPATDMIRMEMMKISMKEELKQTMKTYLERRNNKLAAGDETEQFLKDIEANAVTQITNEVHMANLESVKQTGGERMLPYLSRIRSAATYVACTKPGECTQKTHPEVDEHPCAKGKTWAKKLVDSLCELEDMISDEHPDCPPCCYETEDRERKDWLIKRQFVKNLYDRELATTLLRALKEEWRRGPWKNGIAPKFDIMKITMSKILDMASLLDETQGKSALEVSANGAVTDPPGGRVPKNMRNRENGRTRNAGGGEDSLTPREVGTKVDTREEPHKWRKPS